MLDFPNAPPIDDEFTAGSNIWRYDGTKWAPGGTVVVGATDGVRIGGIAIWPGDATFGPAGGIPGNYLLCNGAYYRVADIPLLFDRIGGGYGFDGTTDPANPTFAVPNLADRSIFGTGASYSIGSAGGAASHILDGNTLPVHAHGLNDPAHAHSHADPSHNHVFSDPGHNHGFPDPGHVHGGNVLLWLGAGGINGIGYSPYNTTPGNTGNAGTGRWIDAAGTGAWNNGAGTGTYDNGAGTGMSVANAGASWGINHIPPYMAFHFIIRFE